MNFVVLVDLRRTLHGSLRCKASISLHGLGAAPNTQNWSMHGDESGAALVVVTKLPQECVLRTTETDHAVLL